LLAWSAEGWASRCSLTKLYDCWPRPGLQLNGAHSHSARLIFSSPWTFEFIFKRLDTVLFQGELLFNATRLVPAHMMVGFIFLNFFMVYTYANIGRAPEFDTSDGIDSPPAIAT
jgi:hypothetical protein